MENTRMHAYILSKEFQEIQVELSFCDEIYIQISDSI